MRIYDIPIFMPLCASSICGAGRTRSAPSSARAKRRWRHEPDTAAIDCGGDGLLRGTRSGLVRSPTPHNTGVYLLLDTSGTYREELDKAKQIINYTLTRLDALDTFAVARIDTGSFSEQDIMAKVTLDDRPSAANQQKREFAQAVDRFLDETPASPYTDITGGLLQAVEFLNEKQPGRKTIFIFSDLKKDLAGRLHTRHRGARRRLRDRRAERHEAAQRQRRPARVPDASRRVEAPRRGRRRHVARHQRPRPARDAALA
mgnify:CR=1 FL=1